MLKKADSAAKSASDMLSAFREPAAAPPATAAKDEEAATATEKDPLAVATVKTVAAAAKTEEVGVRGGGAEGVLEEVWGERGLGQTRDAGAQRFGV